LVVRRFDKFYGSENTTKANFKKVILTKIRPELVRQEITLAKYKLIYVKTMRLDMQPLGKYRRQVVLLTKEDISN